MKKILMAVALISMAGACGGSAADEVLGKMKDVKNKVCACKDKECADKAEKDFEEWMMKNMDKFKNVKPTKAQDEAADKLQDEMEACKKKLEGGS